MCLIWWGISTTLSAQEDSTKTIELSNITIQENRFEIPFSQASRNISVVTRKDIEYEPVQSIPGALSYVPGVDIRQRGPVGVQADISIRGGTFDQTLVLLNGIKLSDPQTGHHLFNVPINLDNVEQIEVLKGPGARIYGQNAFSGAVNIITKVPDTRAVDMQLYGGQFGTYGATASLALPQGRYKQYISYSHDGSDGYRENTDYRMNNLFYQSEMQLGPGQLKFLGGYLDKKFGANSFYTNSFPGQYEETETLLLSAGYQRNYNKLVIKPRAYWRRNEDMFLLKREDPAFYQNIHTTDVMGAELNASWQTDAGLLGFGLEARKEQIESTNLGSRERTNLGLFIEQQLNLWHKLDITPGVYINYYSDYHWNAFPGIDLGYQLTDQIRLYANAGTSYRIPTYTDLYYVGPDNVGNPDLQPEDAFTYEAGIKYLKKGVFWSAVYFNRRSNNLIDYVRAIRYDEQTGQPLADTLQGPFTPQNFQDVTTRGLELSLKLDLSEMGNPAHFINYFTASYNYIDSDLQESQGFNSKYVIDNLNHQFILGLNHKILKNFSNNFRLRAVERSGFSDYVLLDTRLVWQKNLLKIFMEVTNMLDEKYVEVMTPMPGRWYRMGLNYKLKF